MKQEKIRGKDLLDDMAAAIAGLFLPKERKKRAGAWAAHDRWAPRVTRRGQRLFKPTHFSILLLFFLGRWKYQILMVGNVSEPMILFSSSHQQQTVVDDEEVCGIS